MKRYLLFTGNSYYPCGGVEDFVKSFESMEAITQHLEQLKSIYNTPDWCNALDTHTGTKYHIDSWTFKFKKLKM